VQKRARVYDPRTGPGKGPGPRSQWREAGARGGSRNRVAEATAALSNNHNEGEVIRRGRAIRYQVGAC